MLLPLLLAASPAAAPIEKEDRAALERVSRDLCSRQVAVLGEASHGGGHTEAFKGALIERLVTRCGFRAVVFESGLYEFLGFARSQREHRATEAMVGNAISGLWKFDSEMTPLIGFLYREAMAGRVSLGGMDDQIAGVDQPFANDDMPVLLAERLPEARRSVCQAALLRRTHYAYTSAAPYSAADRAELAACIADMRSPKASADLSERGAMLDGLDRAIARDGCRARIMRTTGTGRCTRNSAVFWTGCPRAPR